MRLFAMLTSSRIRLIARSSAPVTKEDVLAALALMLADSATVSSVDVMRELQAREAVLSTGIGEGIAIPHAALANVSQNHAAVVLSPAGFEFDALDGLPVHIAVGLLGPQHQRGEHLKALARVARVFRDATFRTHLLTAVDAMAAGEMIQTSELNICAEVSS
jgi:nitrogen PTS system EIIA component